jgi:hypothetical protein
MSMTAFLYRSATILSVNNTLFIVPIGRNLAGGFVHSQQNQKRESGL